jgi:hypothetical protein
MKRLALFAVVLVGCGTPAVPPAPAKNLTPASAMPQPSPPPIATGGFVGFSKFGQMDWAYVLDVGGTQYLVEFAKQTAFDQQESCNWQYPPAYNQPSRPKAHVALRGNTASKQPALSHFTWYASVEINGQVNTYAYGPFPAGVLPPFPVTLGRVSGTTGPATVQLRP